MHLGKICNCGCMVDGSYVMAAIYVLLIIKAMLSLLYFEQLKRYQK